MVIGKLFPFFGCIYGASVRVREEQEEEFTIDWIFGSNCANPNASTILNVDRENI